MARPDAKKLDVAGWVAKGVRSRMDAHAWERWLRPGERGDWYTTKSVAPVEKGMPVFFFKGAPDSVLVGEGALTGERSEEDGRTLLGIEVVSPFTQPIAQDVMRADPVLAEATFLKVGPVGTFYPLTEGQVRRIRQLVAHQLAAKARQPHRSIRWVFFSRYQTGPAGDQIDQEVVHPCREETLPGDLAVLVAPKVGVFALLEVTGLLDGARMLESADCKARVVATPTLPISLKDLRGNSILKDWNVAKRNLTPPSVVMPELGRQVAKQLESLLVQRGVVMPAGIRDEPAEA